MPANSHHIADSLREALSPFPYLDLAVVFGSMAVGAESPNSDLDIAVQARQPLSSDQKMVLMEALALVVNRPVDLIDLRMAGQPLLHEIVSKGQQILATNGRGVICCFVTSWRTKISFLISNVF